MIIFFIPTKENILARHRSALKRLVKGFYLIQGMIIRTCVLIAKEFDFPSEANWIKVLYHEGRMELLEEAMRKKDIYMLGVLLLSGDKRIMLRVMLLMSEDIKKRGGKLLRRLVLRRLLSHSPLKFFFLMKALRF